MHWWTEHIARGWLGPALAALALAGPAVAQTTGAVQTVSGFRVPDYDENNNLKSILFGDFARILPDGVVEITNLKIDFYSKEGAVEMTVTSPKCLYDQKAQMARSDSGVDIQRQKLRITGTGFWWDQKNEQFEIYQRARVEIRGARARVAAGEQP